MTKAEEIIYNKLFCVMVSGQIIKRSEVEKLARAAVEEIREEFRKTGVDVWPTEGGEE